MAFDEHSETAGNIRVAVEMFMNFVGEEYGVTFKEPADDVAGRFLNEIEEFKPVGE